MKKKTITIKGNLAKEKLNNKKEKRHIIVLSLSQKSIYILLMLKLLLCKAIYIDKIFLKSPAENEELEITDTKN